MSLILGIIVFALLGAIAVYGYKTSLEEAEKLGSRPPGPMTSAHAPAASTEAAATL